QRELSEKREQHLDEQEEKFFEDLPFLPTPKKAPMRSNVADKAAQLGGGKVAEQGPSDIEAGSHEPHPQTESPSAKENADKVDIGRPPPPVEKPERRNVWWFIVQFLKRLGDRNAGSLDDEVEHEHTVKKRLEDKRKLRR
ncbi:MAG: hypothetical protein KDD60_01970, partial [Bdellovibrionales bacterium]|nr:hypothetical protein [Bdellovibrionales bacterium]